ncbi:MAG: hypothetical protein ABIR70_05790 [Bryobacteraceae bacterium]
MRIVALFVLVCVRLLAQTQNDINKQIVAAGEKYRDTIVLHAVPKLRIGIVGISSLLPLVPDDVRRAMFTTLSRYNLPVEWTPSTDSVKADIPTLFVIVNVTTTTFSNGTRFNSAHISLELREKLKLQRDKIVEYTVPVWSEDKEVHGVGDIDATAVSASINQLIEQFCLSYLASNRP